MWADVETKVDFLNYSEVAELAVDVIRNPLMRPVSVGIFGTWGTGKSTLLNLIEDGLAAPAENGAFIVVRFDAWLYQGFDDSRAALMEVIASRLEKAAEADEDLLAKAKKLVKRVNGMRLLAMLAEGGAAATGHHTGGAIYLTAHGLADLLSGNAHKGEGEEVEKAGKAVAKQAKDLLKPSSKRTPPKQIAAFRKEFGELVSGLGKTLVVFIDNLDRCLPTQTINTLEALRLFLFMESTAYVIAADEEMVRHSVTEFFKDLDDRHVIDYLDKLIQVPIRLPRLGVQEVRAYLFLLFAAANQSVPPAKLEELRGGLEDSLRRSWKDEPISTESALALLGPSAPEDVSGGFLIADRIASLLANSVLVAGNPRIVKRMMNVVRMRGRIAKLRGMPFDEALIAKLALFERCMDDTSVGYLYSSINGAAGGKPEQISKLEALREADADTFKAACPEPWSARSDFIQDWLALEPLLGQRDLRPAVYLSRETVPVRALQGGLSVAAAEAVKVLMRSSSTSSPSGKAAVAAIPTSEHGAAMSNMVAELRKHADWKAKPSGFTGAQILADASPEAGAVLAGFLRTLHGGGQKRPPWLVLTLKNAAWINEGKH